MARPKKNKEESSRTAPQEAPQTLSRFEILNVTDIIPSDLNPRKDIDPDAQEELKCSILQYGILEPVIVRPAAGPNFQYELICGYRRWLVMKELEHETIPAIIREDMDDDEDAFELMMTENLQRKDIEPLDEAMAYKALMDHGATVQDLAMRFSKSDKYIRGRLALNNLIDDLRSAYKRGSVMITAAALLGRMTETAQARFFDDYVDKGDGGDPVTAADVREFISDEECSLYDEPFMIHQGGEESWNPQLRPRACAGCPFNSESQGSLFPEFVSEHSQCRNQSCFMDKRERFAWWLLKEYEPNLLPKNQEIEADCIVLARGYCYSGDEALLKKLEERYKDFKIVAHTYDYTRVSDPGKCNFPMFRIIELSGLVNGRCDYMSYYKCPMPKYKDPTGKPEDDHWSVYNRLNNLREKRNDAVRKALEPLFAGIFESWQSTGVADDGVLPEVLQVVVAHHLISKLSYDKTKEVGLPRVEVPNVKKYLEEHSFNSLVAMFVSDATLTGTNYTSNQYLEYILNTIAPDSVKTVMADIDAKFGPKMEKCVSKLADMGYDEYNREMTAAKDEDTKEEETES